MCWQRHWLPPPSFRKSFLHACALQVGSEHYDETGDGDGHHVAVAVAVWISCINVVVVKHVVVVEDDECCTRGRLVWTRYIVIVVVVEDVVVVLDVVVDEDEEDGVVQKKKAGLDQVHCCQNLTSRGGTQYTIHGRHLMV